MAHNGATNAELVAATRPSFSEVQRSGEGWELWKVEHIMMAAILRQHFLFFDKDCRHRGLDEAIIVSRVIEKLDLTIVIRHGAGLSSEMRRFRESFPGARIYDPTLFLIEALKNEFPRPRIPAEEEPYFVEPSVLFPDETTPLPGVARLERWLKAPPSENRNIAVLLADAGVGKSTLAEEVFRSLVNQNDTGIIPLLLKREYWEDLARKRTVEMRDIWNAGMELWYPDARISSADLETCFEAGAIRPILDGFDELCSGFPENLPAAEVILALQKTFDTEGKILLASRGEAWKEHVDNKLRSHIIEVELHPFSPQQREAYLAKRFPETPQKRQEALQLLEKVSGRHPDAARLTRRLNEEGRAAFDRMPLAVMLAAESVDRAGKVGNVALDGAPMRQLLLALCAREKERSVNLDAQLQYSVLETIALEMGYLFTLDDLLLYAMELAPEVPEDVLRRFDGHALIRHTSDDRLTFKYDFIREYLAAYALNEQLLNRRVRAVRDIFDCCNEPSTGTAVIDRWVDVTRGGDHAEVEEALAIKWKSISREGHRLALSQMIVAYARANTTSRSECTRMVARILGGVDATLEGLHLRGLVTGLDLRNYHILNCTFDSTEWVRCRFAGSQFANCDFTGSLSFQLDRDDKLTRANVAESCRLSPKARLALQAEDDESSIAEGVKYSDIVAAVRDTLRLFTTNSMTFEVLRPAVVDKHFRNYPFGKLLQRQLLANNVIGRTKRGVGGDADRVEVADQVAAKKFLGDAATLRGIGKTIDELKVRLVRTDA